MKKIFEQQRVIQMTRRRHTIEQIYRILVAVSEQYGNDWFYIDDAVHALDNVDTGVNITLENKDVPNRLGDMVYDGILEKELVPKGRAFNRYRISDEGLKFLKREREHRERQETLAQKLVEEQVKLPVPENGSEEERTHFKINFKLSKDMIEGIVEAYNNGKEEVTITVDSK